MRHWVSKYLGHSLSDKGLVRVSRRWLKGKSESVKFQTGDLITAGSEEEIFELLHLPWKPPTERDIFEGVSVCVFVSSTSKPLTSSPLVCCSERCGRIIRRRGQFE